MALIPKQFPTDLRLWFWITLVLYILTWFVPFWYDFGKDAVGIFISLSTDRLRFDTNTYGALMGIFSFQLWFSLPAVVFGWILQCVIVMVRAARK
jgi:hypothetical protein